jgi:hypothetical protein
MAQMMKAKLIELKQAAAAIRIINPWMGGAVDGPGDINRPRKWGIVGHSQAPGTNTSLSTRLACDSFQFFPTSTCASCDILVSWVSYVEIFQYVS